MEEDPRGERFSRALQAQSAPEKRVAEEWVDIHCPADARIVGEEEANGYRVSWCQDDKLTRKLDIEDCELVIRINANGERLKFRLRDRPYDQTLIRQRKG